METNRKELMTMVCINCEKYGTSHCPHYMIDEYKNTCSKFVLDHRYGYGESLDCDGKDLLFADCRKLSENEALDKFIDYVKVFGFEQTVTFLINKEIELDSLTYASVSEQSA